MRVPEGHFARLWATHCGNTLFVNSAIRSFDECLENTIPSIVESSRRANPVDAENPPLVNVRCERDTRSASCRVSVVGDHGAPGSVTVRGARLCELPCMDGSRFAARRHPETGSFEIGGRRYAIGHSEMDAHRGVRSPRTGPRASVGGVTAIRDAESGIYSIEITSDSGVVIAPSFCSVMRAFFDLSDRRCFEILAEIACPETIAEAEAWIEAWPTLRHSASLRAKKPQDAARIRDFLLAAIQREDDGGHGRAMRPDPRFVLNTVALATARCMRAWLRGDDAGDPVGEPLRFASVGDKFAEAFREAWTASMDENDGAETSAESVFERMCASVVELSRAQPHADRIVMRIGSSANAACDARIFGFVSPIGVLGAPNPRDDPHRNATLVSLPLCQGAIVSSGAGSRPEGPNVTEAVRSIVLREMRTSATVASAPSSSAKCAVIVDGLVMGMTLCASGLVRALRAWRSQNHRHRSRVSISWTLGSPVRVDTRAGRLMRPLIDGDRLRALIRAHSPTPRTWEECVLGKAPLVGYVDCAECSGSCVIADTVESFEREDRRFTHVEIHPSFAYCARFACVPFADLSSPCGLSRALATMACGGRIRLENTGVHTGQTRGTPTTPLVDTIVARATGVGQFVQGDFGCSALIAIAACGLNGAAINSASMQRGLFADAVALDRSGQATRIHARGGISIAVAAVWRPEDMPFDASTGETPDVLIDPSALASLCQTPRVIREMVASRSACLSGTTSPLDASPVACRQHDPLSFAREVGMGDPLSMHVHGGRTGQPFDEPMSIGPLFMSAERAPLCHDVDSDAGSDTEATAHQTDHRWSDLGDEALACLAGLGMAMSTREIAPRVIPSADSLVGALELRAIDAHEDREKGIETVCAPNVGVRTAKRRRNGVLSSVREHDDSGDRQRRGDVDASSRPQVPGVQDTDPDPEG